MSEVSRHNEWLSLMDVSGPFLAVPVLDQAFPQGLEELDTLKKRKLRQAYDEWREAKELNDPELSAFHKAWIELVLKEGLELDDDGKGDVFKPSSELSDALKAELPEHAVALRPNYAVVDDQKNDKPMMLVAVYDSDINLDDSIKTNGWIAPPAERMVHLCRANEVRLGLVTNGEQWMLVDASVGAVTTYASWYSRLWAQEPITLQAFVTLLGVRRFFVAEGEQLPALLDESQKHQDEVTDALGEQVRRAVEVLIQALGRADVDRNHELLRGANPPELYEAGLTVMMRIVFLLSAEERGLLLLGDECYESNYAVSTLSLQLRAASEEILERRWDAWSRLLAVFRAVYGGIEHETLRMPALGGSLFDPDRFPFLEGRAKETSWKSEAATPLPIDNRTVLLLLDAVQLFQGRTLSYRALDVEQIGYVYEGLLERTAKRAPEPILDLDATQKSKKPWVTLGELEYAKLDGRDAIEKLLEERTGSTPSRIRNALGKDIDESTVDKLLTACHGDQSLRNRIKPYIHLLRADSWGYPLVYPEGAYMVTTGLDRRETGTHYTPKSLTEAIVRETLEPVAYIGPSEGKLRDEWCLRTPEEILNLKICDPAMGSGAFLVQVIRWLSGCLVEAWAIAERDGKYVTCDGQVVESLDSREPLPGDSEERVITARRLIAERCIYGVDLNPLAVELAKLSVWLVTLAKGRPFGFLDHNLRSGDSLLGIHDLEQLYYLEINPGKGSSKKLFASRIDQGVEGAITLRSDLRSRLVRDIRDVEVMQNLDEQVRQHLGLPELIADAFIGEVLCSDGGDIDATILSIEVGEALNGEASKDEALSRRVDKVLSTGLSVGKLQRRPFHWPLEFPEVFDRANPGFDAIVGNPPFLGNRLWKSMLHEQMQWQAEMILGTAPGKIDLSVVFHRRCCDLLRDQGGYGLLATTNIAEGSSIPIGLGKIIESGHIIFAIKSFRWPGKASVTASVICFFKGVHNGQKIADGVECERIGPRLEPELSGGWEPIRVPSPLLSFEGVHNGKGLAFVLEANDPWLAKLREERNSLVRPYVSGNDITKHALTNVERWALDIGDRSLDVIEDGWPVAYLFLMDVVKSTRTEEALKSYKGLAERWWQFWNHRADLMRRLRKSEQSIAYSKITKHPVCMLVKSEWIYTNKVVLVGVERPDTHAICLSCFFSEWVVARQGAKFGVGATLSLSIREAFDTYPLPDALVDEKGILAAERFDHLLKAWCKESGKGLTDFVNRLGDSDVGEEKISKARVLLDEIDQAVCKAYGFDVLAEKRGFYAAPYLAGEKNLAFVVSPVVRTKVLKDLTELNKAQCENECQLSMM